MVVNHFKSNPYERDYYDLDKIVSDNYYRAELWVKELKKRLNEANDNQRIEKKNDSISKKLADELQLIRDEIKTENAYIKDLLGEYDYEKKLTPEQFNEAVSRRIEGYLDSISVKFNEKQNEASQDRDKLIDLIKKKRDKNYNETKQKNKYSNDGLTLFVTNGDIPEKIIEQKVDGKLKLLQQSDPVFNEPRQVDNFLDYRSHFMAPKKHMFGQMFDTYSFNMAVIWLFTFVFYITLYLDFFKRLLNLTGKIKFGKKE
jgi:hypothetical protein